MSGRTRAASRRRSEKLGGVDAHEEQQHDDEGQVGEDPEESAQPALQDVEERREVELLQGGLESAPRRRRALPASLARRRPGWRTCPRTSGAGSRAWRATGPARRPVPSRKTFTTTSAISAASHRRTPRLISSRRSGLTAIVSTSARKTGPTMPAKLRSPAAVRTAAAGAEAGRQPRAAAPRSAGRRPSRRRPAVGGLRGACGHGRNLLSGLHPGFEDRSDRPGSITHPG